MKEIYNGETVALGGVNLVTKQVVVDESTGEKAKFTYDKTTGAVTVLDEVDPDSVNPVTARAVANAVAGASGEVPVIGDNDNGKVLKAVVDGSSKSVEWGEAASGLPASSQADVGKVLTVDNAGDPAWANGGSNVTTATGNFTVAPNTAGEPVTILYPTDVANYGQQYNFIDANTTYDSNTTVVSIFCRTPGYDDNYWTAQAGDRLYLEVPTDISGVGSFQAYYMQTANIHNGGPIMGQSPALAPDMTLYAGSPYINCSANPTPVSFGYGKYLRVDFQATGSVPVATLLTQLQNVGIKLYRQSASLGYNVDLSRYTLGNIENSSHSEACVKVTDSVSKKETVYLPYNLPLTWKQGAVITIQYGATAYDGFDRKLYSTGTDYRTLYCVKAPSGNEPYKIGYLVNYDVTNKVASFVSCGDASFGSGTPVEVWRCDFTNASSLVWTTYTLHELPTYDPVADVGKVLKIGSDGFPVWEN